MIIDELFKIIENRKLKVPEGSYVASLFKAGQDRIIQKVGEEAVEVIIAAKNKNKKRVVSEITDLWFHLFVLMVYLNIPFNEILDELNNRKR